MKRKVTCLLAVAAQIVAGLLLVLGALLYLPLAMVVSAIRAGLQKMAGKTSAASHESAINSSPVSLTANHPD